MNSNFLVFPVFLTSGDYLVITSLSCLIIVRIYAFDNLYLLPESLAYGVQTVKILGSVNKDISNTNYDNCFFA